jgi:hypothetical protein
VEYRLRLLIAVLAVATAAFGVGFMLVPVQIWDLYGVHLDANGAFVARMFGTANVGAGLLLWWARSVLRAHRGGASLVVALCGWSIARGLVTSTALAVGVTNAAGWIFVAYDLALIVICAVLIVSLRSSVRLADT